MSKYTHRFKTMCSNCGKRYGLHFGDDCNEDGTGKGFSIKPKTRLAIARDYQKQIAKLQAEREKVYRKALRKLKLKDTNPAFDWFFNEQQGHGTFVEENLA